MERFPRGLTIESFASARAFSREGLVYPRQDEHEYSALAAAEADDSEECDDEETSLLLNCGAPCAGEGSHSAVRAFPERQSLAQRITRSESFQMTMAFIIVVNTVSLAIQLDNEDIKIEIYGRKVKAWPVINSIFLLCFVVEISLRLIAEGCFGYFCQSANWAWNWFDFLVVALAFADNVLHFLLRRLLHVRSGLRAKFNGATLARTLRILRVLRVLRIFRAFKQLRLLTMGLLESVQVVFWISVLVFAMLFICAIVCTTLIGQNVGIFPEDERDDIRMYWGSVGKSMFTLFQILTQDGWGELDEMVVRQMPWMQLFFFPYVFFGAFVIMSLLTGVMSDHMNDVRMNEEREEHRQRVTAMEGAVEQVRQRDLNHDGRLDRREFEGLFDDRVSSFAADIRALGLKVGRDEARELFDWFDVDGKGYVDHENLRHGMKHLFEGLTPLQLFKLSASVRAAAHFVATAPRASQQQQAPSAAADELLMRLGDRSRRLEERLWKFEAQTRAFMERCGWRGS